MYRRRKATKRSRTPEAAGVAAVAAAMKRRVYNTQKVAAMARAIEATAGVGASGGVDSYAQRSIDRNATMYGIGDYFGKSAGSYLGNLTGIPGASTVGGFLGDKAGDFIKRKLFGRGDYTTTNDLMHVPGTGGAPLFGTMRDVSFAHREYIGDIFGPPAGQSFQVSSYPINPAISETFPFLSQLASNFEEYEFAQLVFSFKSTTTDIGSSTNGQCGSVVMAVNYNASAGPFTDKQTMSAYFGSTTCKSTDGAMCGVECDPQKNAGPPILYTRANPTIPSQDLKTYDLGTFQFAVVNSPASFANLPIGELWVDYTIHLRKPKLYSARGLDVDKDAFLSGPGASLGAAAWFGVGSSTTLTAQQNNIGCQILPATSYTYSGTTSPQQTIIPQPLGVSIIVPPAFNGNLRITVRIYQGAANNLSGTPSLTLLGNIVPINDIYASGNPQPGSACSASTPAFIMAVYDVFVKQATAISYNNSTYSGGQNIIVLGALLAGIPTSASIEVEQYQPLGGIGGLTAPTNRVVWVNQGGIVVVP